MPYVKLKFHPPTVQNTDNLGVSKGKTSVNWSFYAPKKQFYGCDGSSWVYV